MDEEFQKLWRSVAVDGLDDMKIEEYLEKTGFAFMQVYYFGLICSIRQLSIVMPLKVKRY